MNSVEIHRHQQRLDALFGRVPRSADDIELQSEWAKYLCVLVSGFLEKSVTALYGAYAKAKANPNVASFVENRLRGFQNPNMENILKIAGSFSTEWRSTLEHSTEGELKDAVDSIYRNRNRIAHGEYSGITYTQIQQYYQSAIKVVSLIEKQCDE